MALDVTEFLWNKFVRSLSELESESKSGFVTISLFNSSIKDLVSKFTDIKVDINERDILLECYRNSRTIDVLYDLNDALNECRVIVHECKEIKNKLSSLNARRFYTLKTIKTKLSKIEGELQNLSSSSQETEIQELPSSSQETDSPREMTGPMLSTEVFGFEKQSKEIEDLLLGGSRSNGVTFAEIAVIGMAGVGKTTLVQKVLASKEVQNSFDRVLWIPFSGISETEQQYSRFTFETCILNLNKTEEKIVGLHSLLERLGQLLSDKSYLIVLDDICFKLINVMERLLSGLPKVSGGAVIVTSRLKEVTRKLGKQQHLIHIQPQEHVCSHVLKKKLSSISQGESKETLEKVKKLKDQCHGLPSVAKTLAQIFP